MLNFCGDGGKCHDGQLNYFRATGQNDTLHYAWSTVGYPTLFISRSGVVNTSNCNSAIHVTDYSEFKNHQSPGSVKIDGAINNFSFALVFKTIIDFPVDKKKLPSTGAFKPFKNNYTFYDLSDEALQWSSYSFYNGTRGMDTSDRSNMSVTFLVSIQLYVIMVKSISIIDNPFILISDIILMCEIIGLQFLTNSGYEDLLFF